MCIKRKSHSVQVNKAQNSGLLNLGTNGQYNKGINIIRLITHDSLSLGVIVASLTEALFFAEESSAKLIVTPGGYGYVVPSKNKHDTQNIISSIETFVSEILQILPVNRKADIVLGIDGTDGIIQDGYFIPKNANSITDCTRVWKAYPRCNEMHVHTKGKPCAHRCINTDYSDINMLICHDLVAFGGRSQARRGLKKEKWANQLASEIKFSKGAGIVSLVHYLDTQKQGSAFINGMDNLINKGMTWGVSSFKTMLDPQIDSQELQIIRQRTSRFSGPVLDLFVLSA